MSKTSELLDHSSLVTLLNLESWHRPMPLPEPATGLIVLGVGWALGKADRWMSHNNINERDTLIALRELALTVKHLDGSIVALNGSIGDLWERLNEHERRIAHMEGRDPSRQHHQS
jgi:hypothetical protein